ncbi:hypothetical protein BN1708_012712 [Verticillium longisporum]|uniref:protein-ribulosamine 3-kinase n=1 Tax=Verticillium longisporum TaxID=100787 RepID=A0A0G4LCD4_VERLO|nr:hypothetical protein BN1708_012712 [Verticillium longisporum]
MGPDPEPSAEKAHDDPPLEAVRRVDAVILQKLPADTTVNSVVPHGTSHWTQTARLVAECQGRPVQYFLKVVLPAPCLLPPPGACGNLDSLLIVLQTVHGDRGRKVVSGEYRSMTAIHVVMPSLVPRPIAWGSCEDEPDLHFFLSEFRSMTEGLPAIDAFPQRMAQLHRSATSPDGRFGFFEPTCHGHTPIDHGWHETWEAYFASTTRRLFQWEQAAQGPNQDILDLMEPFFSNVIPRLLRPLETDGRSITPSLIHGDLWHGNVATDADTQEPVIFDAASSYAHNEYELGVWRQPWNELGAAYRARYHEFFPPSLPVEDCDDRNALYATRVNILDSILYRDDDEYRKMCVPPEAWLIASMRRLVEKFPGGYEEWKGKQV